jgi:hypothetical protein
MTGELGGAAQLTENGQRLAVAATRFVVVSLRILKLVKIKNQSCDDGPFHTQP